MKHRIAVPDVLLIRNDAPIRTAMTVVAEADSYAHAFVIGRAMAERYDRAYLLTETGEHIAAGWRKADDTDPDVTHRPVITSLFIPDGHVASSMHDPTSREGAPGGGCPQCIQIEISLGQ